MLGSSRWPESISAPSCTCWQLTEALLIRQLPGWRQSKDKSETARQKVHFFDSGLAAALGQLRPATSDQDLGRLVETFLVSELARQAEWLPQPPRLFHWRQGNRHEVDLILESDDDTIVCIEVKSNENITAEDFSGIDAFKRAHPRRRVRGVTFSTGNHVLPFGDDRWVVPYGALLPAGSQTDFMAKADPAKRLVEIFSRAAGDNKVEVGAGTTAIDTSALVAEIDRQLRHISTEFPNLGMIVERSPTQQHTSGTTRMTMSSSKISAATGSPRLVVQVSAETQSQEVGGVVTLSVAVDPRSTNDWITSRTAKLSGPDVIGPNEIAEFLSEAVATFAQAVVNSGSDQ